MIVKEFKKRLSEIYQISPAEQILTTKYLDLKVITNRHLKKDIFLFILIIFVNNILLY